MKRLVFEVTLVLALAGTGYGLWRSLSSPNGVVVSPILRPYVVYRETVRDNEKIVVRPCVPVEVVDRAGEDDPVPSGDTMFPLNLGRLSIDKLPYGGRIETSLVQGDSGAGVLQGTVVPNPVPRWEWLWGPTVGVGVGQSLTHGLGLHAELSTKLFRYKRLTTEIEIEASTHEDGDSDVEYKLMATLPLGKR